MNRDLSSQMLKLPQIIGHRGARGYAPENTLVSFQTAATMGVSCVEFDVKLTADGELIIFHDPTVNRTTSGRGSVNSLSLSEIRGLDAGRWFGSAYTGIKVPTFTELIDLLVTLDLRAIVEIKPSEGQEVATARAVCEELKTRWPATLPPPLLSSFVDECMMVCRDMMPELGRALLVRALPQDWAERARAIDAKSLHVWHEKLTRSQARRIMAEGYTMRCFTVNNATVARKLFQWGIEGVITDFPDRML